MFMAVSLRSVLFQAQYLDSVWETFESNLTQAKSKEVTAERRLPLPDGGLNMGYLGVYKAIYDYEPQGEGELVISDGDILYVLEKSVEDDWWRAKKKASGEEEDEPVGLVPSNYVEEAQPLHQARALYDYTRQTDEELSFSEDTQLEVFDTSDPDWTLVGHDGEYGFVPTNYIEITESTSTVAPPRLPKRPSNLQGEEGGEEGGDEGEEGGEGEEGEEEEGGGGEETPQGNASNPAAALANIMKQRNSSSTRANLRQLNPEAFDEEPPTPNLPTRPKIQSVSSKPVAQNISVPPRLPHPHGVASSPPHNRVAHRGIDDELVHKSPGGFHMYNINEMVTVMGRRKKMPTTLGINIATGMIMIAPEKSRDSPEQNWTADKMTHYSIEGKHVFMELVQPSKSVDFHAGAKDTAEEIVAALGDLAGAVRAEGLRDIILASSGGGQKKGQILYDFMAQGEDEVTVAVGDEVIIVDDTKSEEWWQVKRVRNGKEGVVPSSYIEITGMIQAPSTSGINAGKSIVEQNRLDEERLAKESLKVAQREDDTRAEVGPGMILPPRGSSLSARDSGNSDGQQRSRRENGRHSSNNAKSKPDPSKVRTWNDRSKTFSVEAQFLALRDGKINLHKMNGVKIAVPVGKMSLDDLEYVEGITGISLDEDKPLSDLKKHRRGNEQNGNLMSGAGASIERGRKPEYDWFQFFLSCDVGVGLCERYAQTFARDSMDESVLPDVDSTVLRTLGLREGDIIKVMRFLDKKFGRTAKRNVSFGGEEVISQNSETSGNLFSGPGGALKDNTRKGRPAPVVQTNDVVDSKAFSQDSQDNSVKGDRVATPLASAPTPSKKDVARGGFDDNDVWAVKPSQQEQPASIKAPVSSVPAASISPAPQSTLTGAMGDLSLLAMPLEPVKLQHSAPTPTSAPAPAPVLAPALLQSSQPPQFQNPQPQPVTPAFFSGIGIQNTGIQQQASAPGSQFVPQSNLQQQNIARLRPAPPPAQINQSSLLPAPPSRPLSAPLSASAFQAPPPLQAQTTGYATFQTQIASPGQSLNEINQQRQQQFQQQQFQQQQQQNFSSPQSIGMIPQLPSFNQFQPGQFSNGHPNGFQQFPLQAGNAQNQFATITGAGPFADPLPHQFPPTIQPQPAGFQSSFPTQQQLPQRTGINSFLPPPLQPQPTGVNGLNNNFNQSFTPPPIPPIPQSPAARLVAQKTGPPPPVRFGVNGDIKKLAPQATGRRANLAHATPQNPFGF